MEFAKDTGLERRVEIPFASRRLCGELVVPPRAGGVVVFAHGSGSGRNSPRNRFVTPAATRS
jgi:putative phosphoribosyl transferase